MSDLIKNAAELNRDAWDSFRRQRDEKLVDIRHDSAQDILQGKGRLEHLNIELVGKVQDKRLLDLGCGDGAEMLEWARLGAQVTGVDNSPKQLEAAQRNADKLGISCQLIQADLLNLPDHLLNGEFDIVFSASVTAWIGDLKRWFQNVFLTLKQDGIFLLNAHHPIIGYVKEIERGKSRKDSYFFEGPFIEEIDRTSSWNPAGDAIKTIEWSHTLSSLISAIGQSGLRITHFIEPPDDDLILGRAGWPGMIILKAVKDFDD